MLNFAEMSAIVGKLGGTMKFFPGDVDARMGIVEAIGEMASDLDQVRWLAKWLPKRYQEWPGMHEVRALFCTKFKPRDGVEVYSTVYLDGIPSERETEPLALKSGARQIEAGEPVSADPELALVVINLVQHNTMNVIVSRPEETALRDGESDFNGLVRVMAEHRAAENAIRRGPRAATEAEICEVKRIQAENVKRSHLANLEIRAGENEEVTVGDVTAAR